MDDDDGEEIQDWGSLNKQAETIRVPADLLIKDESLPKRSTKYFEQDGSQVQVSKLDHDRNQMYLALSSIRGHHVKQKLQAVWMEDRALVPHAKGGFFKDLGQPYTYSKKKKLQGLWLSGIETVYLVERGSLVIYEGSTSFERFLDDERQEFDYETLRQMSMSHLYSVVFKDSAYLDKYQVFALLKRLGYLVMDFRQLGSPQELTQTSNESPSFLRSFMDAIASIGVASRSWTSQVKSICSSHYTTYTEVFESLQIIPTYSAHHQVPPLPIDPEYQLVFNVWKPSPAFSKKNPPCPDFQVGVLNTSEIPFPSLSVMQCAWNNLNVPRVQTKDIKPRAKVKPQKQPAEKFPKPLTKKEIRSQRKEERESKMDPRLVNRNKYLRTRDQKLKMGSTGRSVIYAILDNGIINFSSFAETEFKLENCVSDLDAIEHRSSHGIVWNEQLDLTTRKD